MLQFSPPSFYFQLAENAVAIARNGGIDAVVLALKNHRDNINVQQNGCKAIGQFAYKNGKIALVWLVRR